jgi:hypothetical protein
MEARMSPLTLFLARSIGLFTILIVAALLMRGGAIIDATAADGPVMFTYAIISLGLGIAMIVGHNVWSGGVLPIVVTLVGWLIFAKGMVLSFLTPEAVSRLLQEMDYGGNIHLYLAPALIIGLYLAWAGFTAPAHRLGS